MPLRHCGKNEFGIYSRIRCKIFRLKPNANYLNRPINRMAMIGLRKNLRAFEPFGNKILGIHSRIPRHCGRGRRGKKDLNCISIEQKYFCSTLPETENQT